MERKCVYASDSLSKPGRSERRKREGEGKRNREREIQKRDPSGLPTTLPGPDQSESDLT